MEIARRPAWVACFDRPPARRGRVDGAWPRSLASELGGLAVPTDVSRLDDLRALIGQTLAAFGRIDVLVNNAAANARGAFDSLEPEAISTVIDTNLKGPMLLTRLALPYLRQSKGVVVNVASIAGHVPLPGESPYSASKWGLRGFTFAVREETREAVLACAIDRRRERAIPPSTLLLAKLAAMFPWLQELLRPSLEAKGAKVKARLRQQR